MRICFVTRQDFTFKMCPFHNQPHFRVNLQCLERAVWKGLLKILTAIVHGLGASLAATSGNMCTASAFRALEMAHTHYWTRLELSDGGSLQAETAEVTGSTLSTPIPSSTVSLVVAWVRWRNMHFCVGSGPEPP